MTPVMPNPGPCETVARLLDRGFTLSMWPASGESKAPREHDWLSKAAAGGYKLEDFRDGMRVGILHGVPLAGDPDRIVCDVDIDWGPAQNVALALLPTTKFVWGREGKFVSHLLYTVPQVAPPVTFKDIGKNPTTLIEFRPDLHHCMAPPSVWQKDGKREPLTFRADGDLTHLDHDMLKERVALAAVGMLLAKHLGKHGFGHETRLAWAGFLMRLGVSDDDLQRMGEALSKVCDNAEVADVRKVIQTTRTNLLTDGKKVKGGPALAKIIGANGRAVVSRIAEWMGRDADFVRDKDGKIVPKNQSNIARAIERLGYTLSYDKFAERPLIQDGEQPPERIEDSHLRRLYFQIDDEFRFMPPYEFFTQKVQHLAEENTFHAVKDYLDAITWDGVPRLDTWLIECAGAEDSAYVRAVSAIMLMAAVSRAYTPGCKYDEIVVWESPQGVGKSSAARMLCPNPEWFSDDLPLAADSKVLIEKTLGKWIIEVSELAGKRKAEQEQLKAMLSRQVDGPARPAYARFPVERPRCFILIGTTNLDNYLSDPTGGRRWWPLKVTKFDLDWIAANRDQLWAEAKFRVRDKGQSIRLPEHLWPEAAHAQEQRMQDEPWEDIIRAAVNAVEPDSLGIRRIVSDDIWLALGVLVEHRDMAGARTIGQIMQKLGFKNKKVRVGGDIKTGYVGVLKPVEAEPDGEATSAAQRALNAVAF